MDLHLPTWLQSNNQNILTQNCNQKSRLLTLLFLQFLIMLCYIALVVPIKTLESVTAEIYKLLYVWLGACGGR